MKIKGFTPYPKEEARKYEKNRWWLGITLGDMLQRAADFYPNKEALVEGETRMDYRTLRKQVNQFALGLIRQGIKKGDRVLVQLPNSYEFVIAYFAIHTMGGVVVLLNSRNTEFEIGSAGSQAQQAFVGVTQDFASGALVAIVLFMGYRWALPSGGVEHARAVALVALIVAGAGVAALLTVLATRAARLMTVLTLGSLVLFAQWPPAAAIAGLQPLHAADWMVGTFGGLLAAAPALLLRRPGT